MLTIYKRLWQVNWAEQWQYRANLMMYLFYWLVAPIVYLAVWTTIARANGGVQGMQPNDFVTYYMALLIVDQLTSNIVIHVLAYKILDGSLSGELTLPIHPILTRTLVYNVAFKALTFIVLIPIWIVLFLLFRPDFSAVTLGSVLLALPGILIGFGISFLLSAAITCTGFWTQRAYSVHDFFYAFVVLFSGQFVPLTLMPDIVQKVGAFLPFKLYIFVPIQVILNRMPLGDVLREYAIGLVWLVAVVLLFRWVWREGVKRFSAVGA